MQDESLLDGWMYRCIVLTPSASWGRWVDVLAAVSERAGSNLVVFHDNDQLALGPSDNRIFLTSNTRFIKPALMGQVAVIVVETETAASQTTVMTGAKGRDGVIDASKLLVEALLTPATCVVTDASLAATGRFVELFPGFTVEAPAPADPCDCSDLSLASAAAFSLYHGGLPSIGAMCSWSHDLFLYDPRRRDERIHIHQLDMTGGPRSLVHGPDMILPPGEWEFTAKFAIDQVGAVHGLRIEWGVGEDCTWFNVLPGREGIFKVTISHKIKQLGPVELRVKLTEGCMGGYFEFQGGSLKLLAAIDVPNTLPALENPIPQVLTIGALPE